MQLGSQADMLGFDRTVREENARRRIFALGYIFSMFYHSLFSKDCVLFKMEKEATDFQ